MFESDFTPDYGSGTGHPVVVCICCDSLSTSQIVVHFLSADYEMDQYAMPPPGKPLYMFGHEQ
jgi:hypothetical protein